MFDLAGRIDLLIPVCRTKQIWKMLSGWPLDQHCHPSSQHLAVHYHSLVLHPKLGMLCGALEIFAVLYSMEGTSKVLTEPGSGLVMLSTYFELQCKFFGWEPCRLLCDYTHRCDGVLCQQRSHCSRWDMWGNAPSFLWKCVKMISTRISVSVIQGHYPMTMLTAVTWKSIASLSVFFKVTREKFSLKSHCFFFLLGRNSIKQTFKVCFSVYM